MTKEKVSYAAAAAKAPPTNPSPPKTKAKKKALTPLFKADYTKINREFIVELTEPAPTGVTTNSILSSINSVLEGTGVYFLLCRLTNKENIVFQTPPHIASDQAIPYTDNITCKLQSLGLSPSSAKPNSCWSKFILHGVPTIVGDENLWEEQL